MQCSSQSPTCISQSLSTCRAVVRTITVAAAPKDTAASPFSRRRDLVQDVKESSPLPRSLMKEMHGETVNAEVTLSKDERLSFERRLEAIRGHKSYARAQRNAVKPLSDQRVPGLIYSPTVDEDKSIVPILQKSEHASTELLILYGCLKEKSAIIDHCSGKDDDFGSPQKSLRQGHSCLLSDEGPREVVKVVTERQDIKMENGIQLMVYDATSSEDMFPLIAEATRQNIAVRFLGVGLINITAYHHWMTNMRKEQIPVEYNHENVYCLVESDIERSIKQLMNADKNAEKYRWIRFQRGNQLSDDTITELIRVLSFPEVDISEQLKQAFRRGDPDGELNFDPNQSALSDEPDSWFDGDLFTVSRDMDELMDELFISYYIHEGAQGGTNSKE